MKIVTTMCEPVWIGKDRESILEEGYWSVKIIYEFTPGLLDKLLGKKPHTVEQTYTNLTRYASAYEWRDANGDEIESFSFMAESLGQKLRNHLEKFIASKTMEKIQNQIIK